MPKKADISKKNSILLYGDYYNYIEALPMGERGKLLTALLDFAKTGNTEEASLTSNCKMTVLVYRVIISQAMRDRDKYMAVCEKNRQIANGRWETEQADGDKTDEKTAGTNASKRDANAEKKDANAPKRDANARKRDANGYQKDNDKDKDKDKDKDTDTDKEKEPSRPFGTRQSGQGALSRRSVYSEKRSYGQRSYKPPAYSENLTFDPDEFFRRALESTYGKPLSSAEQSLNNALLQECVKDGGKECDKECAKGCDKDGDFGQPPPPK